MQKKLVCFIGIASLALAGCYETFNDGSNSYTTATDTAASVAMRINFETDVHRGIRQFTGPVVTGNTHLWFIRGWQKAEQAEWDYQAYVAVTLSDWAFFNAAWSFGKRLELTQISRDVGRCSSRTYGSSCIVTETLGIELTKQMLMECAQKNGLAFKIEGKAGSIEAFIPQHYCEGVLSKTAV